MHPLLYKNKSSLLKIKRYLNSLFGIELMRYPTDELHRRIALLKHHKIDVILDIGANIGQYGCEMRNLGFTGKIISFEPLKSAFSKLQKASADDMNWEVFNTSLGERNGTATINIAKNSVSSSIMENLPQLTDSAPEAQFVTTEEIQICTLDSIFDKLNIQDKNIYLKIDTQGYEEMVLQGAKETLNVVKGIQLEMSFIPSYKGTVSFEDMKIRLNDLGFKLLAIENGFYDKVTGKQLEVDGIFYK